MFNWFNFYPVGHGLFYAGIIGKSNYKLVYDCGTTTAGVNIDRYINHLCSYVHDNTLDFIAISHLHKDHISGIGKLISLLRPKKVFLPYLCDDKEVSMFFFVNSVNCFFV